jgi:hypothetical protein
MDLSLIRRLIDEDDPLQTFHDVLTGEIWTAERFAEARRRGDVYRYLREWEHAASTLEREVYDVYGDVYALLEADDPRRDRVEALHDQDQYTLLLIDALSLRELPLIREALDAHGLDAEVDFALSPLPSETSDFARRHYNGSGPSDIANHAHRYPFAFRHVTSEGWRPDFAPDQRQRFIWYVFPDDYFGVKETDYARHVVQPVERILEAVLGDPGLVRPLIITSDHGYIWQGDQCPWPVADARERALLAEHFKLGRSCHDATDALAATGKVWVEGSVAAARGRFAWGGQVRGATSLFKHGGVSLMECLVPWMHTRP